MGKLISFAKMILPKPLKYFKKSILTGLLGCVFCLAAGKAPAQTLWEHLRAIDPTPKTAVEPKAEFVAGPWCIENQLNALLDSQALVNLKATRIAGYRILLYTGNSRDEANKAKEKAYRIFGNSDVYTSYQQPTFKVRLGDYYDKLEAFFALKKLENAFPKSVIVQELVNLQ